MIDWLAENYTPQELSELLMLEVFDLVSDDGLCAGGYDMEEEYPVAEERWVRPHAAYQ